MRPPAKTRGFSGAINTSTRNVHSIHINEKRGKFKKKILISETKAHVTPAFPTTVKTPISLRSRRLRPHVLYFNLAFNPSYNA